MDENREVLVGQKQRQLGKQVVVVVVVVVVWRLSS
jgi:hypothetical protein